MTAERKLRILAEANATLQTFFGGGSPAIFRWFDVQIPQGFVGTLTCARLQRISTERLFAHASFPSAQSATGKNPPLNLTRIRFQLDIVDQDTEHARQAAIAVINFLGGISLVQDDAFGSPVTTPQQFPCFVLNQRASLYVEQQPPLPVVSLDFRAYNFEEQ